MKISHADYRPGKRPRFVPSGSPRRKFPLIRILLLVALGVFTYTRFEPISSTVRDVVNPVTVWNKISGGGDDGASGRLAPAWSRDSSRVTWECPRGLDAACCESLGTVDETLCGTADALLAKARWKGALTPRTGGPGAERTLKLEARAAVSELGDWGYELSTVRGPDASGLFAYRRTAGAGAWCDTRRGCLKATSARPPLTDGRLLAFGGPDPVRAGASIVRWTSHSPRVRAVLPGRVIGVDSAAAPPGLAAAGRGRRPSWVKVRVYHGAERYAAYGPLTAAPGVKAGALVKAGSYLGDAPPAGGAAGTGYTLTMGLRQGGQPLDAAALWDRPPLLSGPSLSANGVEALVPGIPR